MIEAQLPSNWRELADEFRLIPHNLPPQLGAKVTDIAQPLRLVFYHVATNCSLRTATAMGAAAQIVDISPVALHLWMRKLGPYLAALLELTTDSQQIFAPSGGRATTSGWSMRPSSPVREPARRRRGCTTRCS